MKIIVDAEGAVAIVALIDCAMRMGAKALPAIDRVRQAMTKEPDAKTQNEQPGTSPR